jgi:hypothetical protein
VSAIKQVGDVLDVQVMPPEISQRAIEARQQRLHRRVLAKEEDRLEPDERGVSHKYRRRKLHELSSEEIVAIGHARLVEERARRDIAEDYKVSIGLVSRVASKCKSGLQFVEERQSKEQLKAEHLAAVRDAVGMTLSAHGRIRSVAEVRRLVQSRYQFELPRKAVRRIMVAELGLRFRPLKTVNQRANSNMAVIQRQQYAI